MTGTRWRDPTLAVLTGLLVFAGGRWIESAIIRGVGATGHQLEWISDLVALAATTTLSYLWLHLKAARARMHDLEQARIILGEQLRLAAEIQRTLLPTIPPATPGVIWAAEMRPALEVGGDFFDFLRRGDDVLVVLGDVSGKGVPAAMLQSSLKTLFRVHAAASSIPRTIAARMSEGLREQTGGLPYATAIVAHVEPARQRLTYVNAGHPPGLLVRGSRVFELAVGGPPLGLLPDISYEEGALDLSDGDLGVLITDGISEAVDGIPSSMAQILEEAQLSRSTSPAQVCAYLLQVSSHTTPPGAGNWHDDRTALIFRMSAEAGEAPRSPE